MDRLFNTEFYDYLTGSFLAEFECEHLHNTMINAESIKINNFYYCICDISLTFGKETDLDGNPIDEKQTAKVIKIEKDITSNSVIIYPKLIDQCVGL